MEEIMDTLPYIETLIELPDQVEWLDEEDAGILPNEDILMETPD